MTEEQPANTNAATHTKPLTKPGRQLQNPAALQTAKQKRPVEEQRQHAIEKYEEDCLTLEDPLAASLGAMSSGLMRIGAAMEKVIVNSLKNNNSDTSQKLQDILPAINMHNKVNGQVGRYTQLSNDLSKSTKDSSRN